MAPSRPGGVEHKRVPIISEDQKKRFYLNCFTDLSDVMMMTTTGNDDDGSCSFILGSVPVSLPTHLTLFSKDLFLHIFILFRSLSSCSLFSTPSYILCTELPFFVSSSCIPASFQPDKETTSFKLCMWRIFTRVYLALQQHFTFFSCLCTFFSVSLHLSS